MKIGAPLLLLVLPLLSCGDAGTAIDCAVEGAAQFEHVCTLERDEGPKGAILTVRAPDGHFRRLLATDDGRISVADGALPATVSAVGPGLIEVAIDGDRYRLPAVTGGGK